jgi:hypothetical protein
MYLVKVRPLKGPFLGLSCELIARLCSDPFRFASARVCLVALMSLFLSCVAVYSGPVLLLQRLIIRAPDAISIMVIRLHSQFYVLNCVHFPSSVPL